MSATLRRERYADPTVTADGTMCDENKVNKILLASVQGVWMSQWVCGGGGRERERELKVFKFVINGTNFGYYIIVKLKGHFLLAKVAFTSLSIILL